MSDETPADTPRTAFKHMIDAGVVDFLTSRLHAANPRFDARKARAAAVCGLDSMELKARVAHVAGAITACMPGPVESDLALLVAVMGDPAPSADGITANGFRWWPFSDIIANHGLSAPDAAFSAMVELTRRFTSEFAVRPFLAADLDGTLQRLAGVVDHPDLHVRRWVSEGTRTRLPWGARVPGLAAALDRRMALLERLRHDPERYVQRSVANHLGDILKDDEDAGLDILERWSTDDHRGTAWIVRHAARLTLKRGHPRALALFGFDTGHNDEVAVDTFRATPRKLAIGASVVLSASFHQGGGSAASLRIDFALVGPGARNGTTRKVFRWTERTLAPGERCTLTTTHAFVPRSIRPVRPGPHRFELLVNGVIRGEAEVVVTA
jgi:3-methyladenine DNA glycosylase AlkC